MLDIRNFALLILIGLSTFIPVYSQDDMYGDGPKPEEPEIKVIWNDTVTSEYSIIYLFHTKGYTLSTMEVQLNGQKVGQLKMGQEINYKVFSEGKLVIMLKVDGREKHLHLQIEKGKKYFIEADSFNPKLLRQVTEVYAKQTFFPLEVLRLEEDRKNPIIKDHKH